MTGIRVTGIPAEIPEKQLRTYFCNPENGGGPVRQIYYPLQNNSAVILFESPSVMSEIFKRKHRLNGIELEVSPLPRQIYDKGTMEIDKGVSVIISFQRSILDELQYIGNLKVDFDYNQECYMLKGTWYQLEWALHMIDRTLDFVEGISKTTTETKEQPPKSKQSNARSGSSDGSPVRTPSATPQPQSSTVRPGSPLTSESPRFRSDAPDDDEFGHTAEAAGYTGAAGYTPETFNTFSDEEDLFSGRTKTKVMTDTRKHAVGQKNKNKHSQQTAIGQNKNVKGPTVPSTGSSSNRDTKKEWKGRVVSFKKGTDFTESKPRPTRPGPPLTSGLDVSLAGFGGKQLSFTFELKWLKVMVVKTDITKQRTDGIVSPNTPYLTSTQGVSGAIARAADRRFQMECQQHVREHGPLEMAEVMHTNAGGNLNHHVGFILHVVGPDWHEKNCEASMHYLVCTYLNCFQYSEATLWLKSLSTPLISAGFYGFPLDSCIQAFFDALLIHTSSDSQSPHLQEVQLVCFDSDSTGAAIMILQSLLEVDRKESESAAFDRYQTGCTKYGFQAKMLKKTPDSGKSDDNDETQQTDKTMSNGGEHGNTGVADKSQEHESIKAVFEKNDILISNMHPSASERDINVRHEQSSSPNSVDSKTKSIAMEQKYDSSSVSDKKSIIPRYSNEGKTYTIVEKLSKEANEKQQDNEDSKVDATIVIKEDQVENDSGGEKESHYDSRTRNMKGQDKEDVGEMTEKYNFEAKLLDDKKRESVSSSSETEDTEISESKVTDEDKLGSFDITGTNKIAGEETSDDGYIDVKNYGCNELDGTVNELDTRKNDIEDSGVTKQSKAYKAYVENEKETKANRKLVAEDNLDTETAFEELKMPSNLNENIEGHAEIKARDIAEETNLLMGQKDRKESLSKQTTDFDSQFESHTPDRLNETSVNEDDFSQSQWSIIPGKMVSDETEYEHED